MKHSIELEQPKFEVDLTALNETERSALLLLAEGHTVKSIANLSGRSLAAINERLRNARRKTGVGSSRELARLLKTQENCHQKSEMATDHLLDDPASAIAAKPQRSTRREVIMVLSLSGALIAAVVGISLQHGSPVSGMPASVAPDPELYALLPADPFDAAALHERLRLEPRIADWADRSEAALRGVYSRIPYFNESAKPQVRCGATLCEVTSVLPLDKDIPEEVRDEFYRSLQSPKLGEQLAGVGLVNKGTLFTSTKTALPRPLFVSIWSRESEQRARDSQLADALPREERGLRARYARIREEVRDPHWYSHTESGLRDVIDGLNIVRSELKIRCAATLCEVVAVTPARVSDAQTTAFFERLQSRTYEDGLARLGLKGLEATFSAMPGDRSRKYFVSYLARTQDLKSGG